MILQLLCKFEYFFDGTLGMRETAPKELELKDGATPLCLRPYPIPRVYKKMLRKESEILLKLEVLKEANESEWGAPSYDQPKEK